MRVLSLINELNLLRFEDVSFDVDGNLLSLSVDSFIIKDIGSLDKSWELQNRVVSNV
jgi:hypothetical protein